MHELRYYHSEDMASLSKGETIESMPEVFIDNPEPRLKANKGLAKDRIFDIEKNLNRTIVSANGGSIEKTELMTYGDFALAQSGSPNGYPEVSGHRSIWVVTTHYPKGCDHPKVGWFENATVTSTYDAETGELLGTNCQGKGQPAKSVRPYRVSQK